MRILIIEDEAKMASFLERGLKEEHYTVDIAHDGEKGWEYAMTNEYDLLIVDWMLQDERDRALQQIPQRRKDRSRIDPDGQGLGGG
jgi:DNA-binding response OmpR family regulator